jgi:hypothetical protein
MTTVLVPSENTSLEDVGGAAPKGNPDFHLAPLLRGDVGAAAERPSIESSS